MSKLSDTELSLRCISLGYDPSDWSRAQKKEIVETEWDESVRDRLEISRDGPRGMGNYIIKDPVTGIEKEVPVNQTTQLDMEGYVEQAKKDVVRKVHEEGLDG